MSESLETGVLHRDDNLAALKEFPDESVDLIYLDPPFFSNKFYEVIWGDEAEVRSFEDRWSGGIQHYIEWMDLRASELHRVLKTSGSLYLHCDPHASHYLKVMLDGHFGMGNFRSEVIWKRTGSHNSAKRWGPIHDTLLFYAKSDRHTWNQIFQPYSKSYIEQAFRSRDERGLYQPVSLTGPGIRTGESGEPWRGTDPTEKGRHWQPPSAMYDLYEELTGESLAHLSLPKRLDQADAAGLIYWPKKEGGVPRFKHYLHLLPGQPALDMITDIPPLSSHSAERRGYPTQKPEALLERIVGASSNEGEIVLDPFCGCGTTVAVADRLKRQYIGIDISPTAIEIMKWRLLKQGCSPTIAKPVESIEDLRALKPFEFQNWIVSKLYGTHSARRVHDMGIDGYSFFTRDPIQVKQSFGVGRNVVDNFQTAIRRAGHTEGWIIAFSFTRGAHEEAARARKDEGLDIKLVKVQEVLLQVRRPTGKLVPTPADVADLPLPPVRKQKDLPTVDELIESDKREVG